MSDDLIKQVRAGAPLRPKRWSGDTHADLGGSIDEDATDELLNALADEIERLRAALVDVAQSGPHCRRHPDDTHVEVLMSVELFEEFHDE